MKNHLISDPAPRRLLFSRLHRLCWQWPLAMLLSLALGLAYGQPGARQPTLNIFSTQIIENLKETGNAAQTLENQLQEVIDQLERQQHLFKESKCEGAFGDQGCKQLSRQMAATYKQMLTIMGDRLPDMEHSIINTRNSLQKRLAKEFGHRRTGRDLQYLLRANQHDRLLAQRTRIRRHGVRLSDRFRQYFQLVNQGSGESLALLGAEMYLDMDETAKLIQLTQQQIERSKLIVDLSDSFGTLTPEMKSTVSGVKRIIFGEYEEDDGFVPAAMEGDDKSKTFCSEFDPDC